MLFIGRHTGYPAALEGALKLKEISYVHAEGYPAGELKHGPIALVEEGVPVVAVATECHVYPKMLSNIQEVRARGAAVIAVASEGDEEIAELRRSRAVRPADARAVRARRRDAAAAAARVPRRQAARLRRRPAPEPRQERHGRVAEPGSRRVLGRFGGYPSGVEILGLGVDICEIERMERALARHPTMRERVFTPEEIAYCDAKARPAESYAGRFAAREAVIKALGGYRGKRWQDISVDAGALGRARRSASRATRRPGPTSSGISEVLVTFTHEKTSAVAFAWRSSG